MQESRCMFHPITPNLPIMRHAYVPLIVLVTEFSTEWCKIDYNRRTEAVFSHFSGVCGRCLSWSNFGATLQAIKPGVAHAITFCRNAVKDWRKALINGIYKIPFFMLKGDELIERIHRASLVSVFALLIHFDCVAYLSVTITTTLYPPGSVTILYPCLPI